jgi:hypothetical protein
MHNHLFECAACRIYDECPLGPHRWEMLVMHPLRFTCGRMAMDEAKRNLLTARNCRDITKTAYYLTRVFFRGTVLGSVKSRRHAKASQLWPLSALLFGAIQGLDALQDPLENQTNAPTAAACLRSIPSIRCPRSFQLRISEAASAVADQAAKSDQGNPEKSLAKWPFEKTRTDKGEEQNAHHKGESWCCEEWPCNTWRTRQYIC